VAETCNTIPDIPPEEDKHNIEIELDSACESTVLMCERLEEPLLFDETWSFC
jgi:hypothetical protein